MLNECIAGVRPLLWWLRMPQLISLSHCKSGFFMTNLQTLEDTNKPIARAGAVGFFVYFIPAGSLSRPKRRFTEKWAN